MAGEGGCPVSVRVVSGGTLVDLQLTRSSNEKEGMTLEVWG
jgi:hypothetical protein